jgi:hypothetical protein
VDTFRFQGQDRELRPGRWVFEPRAGVAARGCVTFR